MAYILDASVAMTWAFPDEANESASAALDRLRTEVAYVPAMWWFEVRNVLLINERRQRIGENDTTAFLVALSGMNIEIDRSPGEAGIVTLCRRHLLSVYDAAYLELALRRRLPLASLDKRLVAAATIEGVPPVA
jgi:predicted nucleic acid-binding protein